MYIVGYTLLNPQNIVNVNFRVHIFLVLLVEKVSVPLFLPVFSLSYNYTGVLISPSPDKEGNKLMFLLEWSEFPLTACLAGKKIVGNARLDVVEIARVLHMLPVLFPSWSN